ncbi:MAG: hypothetical protein CMM54_06255 [Rhodospirillaceae bacterium]|nr:hypothetical protein [Rhodospirillaceae bacterium]
MEIEKKIFSMGIDLPNIAENYKNNTSGAKYVSHYSVGTVLYLSGCTPMKDGKPYMTGVLGDDLSVEQGYEAARQCMICYLGAIKYALEDLDRVVRMLHLVGYVNSGESFTEQPRVINGAVDILVEIFGRKVMPTRAAIGCRGLASNHSVELIATIEFDGEKVSDPIARDGEPLD